mgnify:CR=1 FL=1
MSGGKHLLGRPKRHIFGTAKVGEKGQIVIPKGARELFDIQPGDQLLLMADKKRGIALVDPGEVYLPPELFSGKEDDDGNSEG